MAQYFCCPNNPYRSVENDVLQDILFEHANLAFRVGDFWWRARRKSLAVVILQQEFPTQLFAPYLHTNGARWMLN